MKSATMVVVAVAGMASSVMAWHPPLEKGGPGRLVRLPQSNPPEAFPFSDNFDSYAVGPLAGNGTWLLWAAGSVDGQVSTEQAFSAPNSFKMVPQTDIVQTGDATSGIWEIKAMTYFPSSNQATTTTGGGFLIGLNNWLATAPGSLTEHYSMQLQWYKPSVAATCKPNCDNSTVAPCLNVNDFSCFLNAYGSASVLTEAQQISSYANYDSTTTTPVLNINDFIAFNNSYAAGCTNQCLLSRPVVRDQNQVQTGCTATGTTVPIALDQWAEIRVVINLTTDKYDAYYNGAQFVTQKSWTKGVLGCNSTINPVVRVQAFDFFMGTAATFTTDKFYYDNVTFQQLP